MSLPTVECIYITEDCIREWKNGSPSFKGPKSVPMLRFLYELCWTMVRGELPFQKCKLALDSAEFLDRDLDEDMGSNFADIITQMAQDVAADGYGVLAPGYMASLLPSHSSCQWHPCTFYVVELRILYTLLSLRSGLVAF